MSLVLYRVPLSSFLEFIDELTWQKNDKLAGNIN